MNASQDDPDTEEIENLLHDALSQTESAMGDIPSQNELGDAQSIAGSAEGEIRDAIRILESAEGDAMDSARMVDEMAQSLRRADDRLDEAFSMMEYALHEIEDLKQAEKPTATVTVQMGANTIAYEVTPSIPTDNEEGVMNVIAHTVASGLHYNPATEIINGTLTGGDLPNSLLGPDLGISESFPFTDEEQVDVHPAIDDETAEGLRNDGIKYVDSVRNSSVNELVDLGVPREDAEAAKLIYGTAIQ